MRIKQKISLENSKRPELYSEKRAKDRGATCCGGSHAVGEEHTHHHNFEIDTSEFDSLKDQLKKLQNDQAQILADQHRIVKEEEERQRLKQE